MPKTWYVKSANRIKEDDSDEIIAKKEFYNRICSNKKPYFFMYNYTNLKTEYKNYESEADFVTTVKFGKHINELLNSEDLTQEEAEYVKFFYKYAPLDCSPGTINRICWQLEKIFDNQDEIKDNFFDYSILKSGIQYSKQNYNQVKYIYEEYKKTTKRIAQELNEGEEFSTCMQNAVDAFKEQCEALCIPNKELCDIVLDICYLSNNSKQFAWDICGDIIVENLLEKNNNEFFFPIKDESGDIEFRGDKFLMKRVMTEGEN